MKKYEVHYYLNMEEYKKSLEHKDINLNDYISYICDEMTKYNNYKYIDSLNINKIVLKLNNRGYVTDLIGYKNKKKVYHNKYKNRYFRIYECLEFLRELELVNNIHIINAIGVEIPFDMITTLSLKEI